MAHHLTFFTEQNLSVFQMMTNLKGGWENFVEFVSALNLKKIKSELYLISSKQCSGFLAVCSEETTDPCLAMSCM